MKRNISFVEGEYYHLYNRGNSKQKIFLDDKDRDRFVKLLYLCNSTKNINFRDDIVSKKIDAWDFEKGDPVISIGAWVLMPNHFHLLVTIPRNSSPMSNIGEGNEISFFMKKLLTSYSKYFNKKHDRTGSLFESNFKSSHIDSGEYGKYIFSYIHLNPIKLIDPKWKEEGIKNLKDAKVFLDTYRWSSYRDFCGIARDEFGILSVKDFPEYFIDQKEFKKEVFEWLKFSPMLDIGERA